MGDRLTAKERLGHFLKTKKGRRFALILLSLAAILLVVSSFLPGERRSAGATDTDTFSAEAYGQELETRLEKILSSMEGVGSCRVMVTLENRGETYYVTGNKTQEEIEETGEGSYAENHQKEETYIIIEDEEGGQSALSRKGDYPVVRGVLVVCAGGESASVRASVTQAVSTALGLGTDKVFVAGGTSFFNK